ADGKVFVAGGDKTLRCFDSTTGKEQWSYVADGEVYWAGPTVHEDVVYFGTRGGALHAVDAQTGRGRWKLAIPRGTDSVPYVSEGLVFVVSLEGTLFAVALANGKVRWKLAAPDKSQSSPAGRGGLVYFSSGNSDRLSREETHLIAVEVKTGK